MPQARLLPALGGREPHFGTLALGVEGMEEGGLKEPSTRVKACHGRFLPRP